MQISEYDLIQIQNRADKLLNGKYIDAKTISIDITRLVAVIRSLRTQLDAANLEWA